MRDLLFGNNNESIVRKITWRTICTDKRRNFFVITAIVLTTVLLAVAFSVGMSMLKSMEMQKIRMAGSVADAYLSNPTDEQLKTLRELDYIDKVGTGIAVGSANNKQAVGNINLMLIYVDAVQWKEINAPAFSNITGDYPSAENEIMLSRWTLEHMGIDTPELGMCITLSYDVMQNQSNIAHEGTFTLSGYFTNYYYANSGGADYALVSKVLSDQYSCTSASLGTANIVFKNYNRIYSEKILEDIVLNDGQEVIAYDTDVSGDSYLSTFAVLLFLALLFMAGGYLLIYNTMLISLSRDIRNYAQLKTLGMTPRQIRKVVSYTVIFLCCIGIPLGLIIATLISGLIVPRIISANGIFTGSELSYSPFIYIGASVFSFATAIIAAFVPARKVSSISPVEGGKYAESIARAIPIKATRKYSKPVSMAFRNIFRGGKRCVVVIVSMTLSIVILVFTATIVSSIDAEKYAAETLDCDIRLANGATDFHIGSDIFSDELLSCIDALPHVRSKQIVTEAMCRATHDGTPFYGSDTYIPVFGVDRSAIHRLNEMLGLQIDVESFNRGDFALMEAYDPDRWQTVQQVGGELVTGVSETGRLFELPLGAVLPSGAITGIEGELLLFVSNDYLKDIADNLQINRINLDFEDGKDDEAYYVLREFARANNNIFLASRYECRQSVNESITMLTVLGGSISIVFAIIGVLNFINVMAVGVLSRRQELAILECVGMECGQVRKMLLLEGIGYGAISLFFGNVLGVTIVGVLFAGVFASVPYMALHFPVMLFALFYGLILLVCITTPLVVYASISSETVSERLRQTE